MNTNNPKNKQYNRQLILIELSDGQWHRNMELKKATKLTARTLSKHLNELERIHWIERKQDKISGLYPYPVLYKATRGIIAYGIYLKEISTNLDNIGTSLRDTEDPLQILGEFHKVNEYYFTLALERIQQNKQTITLEELDLIAEMFLYTPYENYVKELLEVVREQIQFGKKFDIERLKIKHNVWKTDE